MAKISALPLLAEPAGTETVVVLDGGVAKRTSIALLAASASAPAVAAAELAAEASKEFAKFQSPFIVPPSAAHHANRIRRVRFFKQVRDASGAIVPLVLPTRLCVRDFHRDPLDRLWFQINSFDGVETYTPFVNGTAGLGQISIAGYTGIRRRPLVLNAAYGTIPAGTMVGYFEADYRDGDQWGNYVSLDWAYVDTGLDPLLLQGDPAFDNDVGTQVAKRFADEPALVGPGKKLPMRDDHDEFGSWSYATDPLFLKRFIKRARVIYGEGDYRIHFVDLTSALRRIVIRNHATGTTGAVWKDETPLGADPDFTTMDSVVVLTEYDLSGNVGFYAVLELDWTAVTDAIAALGGGPFATLQQGGLDRSIVISGARARGFIAQEHFDVEIVVGYDKASFIGSIEDNKLEIESDLVGIVTPGLLVKGDVLPGTLVTAYAYEPDGVTLIPDTFIVNKPQSVASTAMSVGREYDDILAAMADPRYLSASPENTVAIRCDVDDGSEDDPIAYQIQGLVLWPFTGLIAAHTGAKLAPVDPDSAVALIEQLVESKIKGFQFEMTKGYGIHTRPGAGGGPNGFGLVRRITMTQEDLFMVSGPTHNTRHIAGDASSGLLMRSRNIRHKCTNPARTFPAMYMHDVQPNATYPNLAQSEGMLWEVIDCTVDNGLPLVHVHSIDTVQRFGIVNRLHLSGCDGALIHIEKGAGAIGEWLVTGKHNGPVVTSGGANPIVDVGQRRRVQNGTGAPILKGRFVYLATASAVAASDPGAPIDGFTIEDIAAGAWGYIDTRTCVRADDAVIPGSSAGPGRWGLAAGGALDFAAAEKRGQVSGGVVKRWG